MELETLDQATSVLATRLYTALDDRNARTLRFAFRVTPDGSVSAPEYWFIEDEANAEVKDYPSDPVHRSVVESANAHWRLTQDLGLPRWYKMTVTVERSGKFGVDFEYKDDYREGDIMQRG